MGNCLSSIPEAIGELSTLTRLDLSHNQLVGLPAEIGLLTKLTKLDLNANRLASLPAELGQLVHLKELYVHAGVAGAGRSGGGGGDWAVFFGVGGRGRPYSIWGARTRAP